MAMVFPRSNALERALNVENWTEFRASVETSLSFG
jgi:hypothetical protein